MSDQWSNSANDQNRMDPLLGTPGGGNVGDRSSSTASTGSGATGQTGSQGQQSTDTGTMDKAKEAMSSVQQKASEIGDQATTKADAGMEKAAGGLDSLASTLRDKGQSMGEGQVGNMATMAADKLESGAELLRSKDTDQLVSELEALIRKRPVESLLVAVGAGYLLSRAL